MIKDRLLTVLSTLTGQLNEVELESQTLKASLEDLRHRHQLQTSALEKQTQESATRKAASIESLTRVAEVQADNVLAWEQLREANEELAAKAQDLDSLSASHDKLGVQLKNAQVRTSNLWTAYSAQVSSLPSPHLQILSTVKLVLYIVCKRVRLIRAQAKSRR